MNESKIQQSSRALGKNIRLGALVSVLALILLLVVTLNVPGVQRKLWYRFVEPQLVKVNLNSDFQGFNYIFPNSFELQPLKLYTDNDTLINAARIEVTELIYSQGWQLGTFQVSDLEINVAALQTLMAEQKDTTPTQDFSITVHELHLPKITFIGDTLFTAVELHGNGLHYDKALHVDRMTLNGQWDTIPFQFEGETLKYHEDSISGFALLDLPNMAQLKGAVYGSLNALSFDGSVQVDSIFSRLPPLILEYDIPLYFDIEGYCHAFDSIRSTFTFKNATMAGSITCDGALTGEIAVDMHLDLFENGLKHFPARIPYGLLPITWDVKGSLAEGSAKDVRINARANSGLYTLKFSDLSSLAFIEASIKNTGLQNLKALTFKSAIKPNITSILTEDWNATGVFPKLEFSTHTSKGLSFDFHHGSFTDSVWLSCLDTLLDLEGYVVKEKAGYAMDVEAHAVGLDLFDALDTGQVISGQFHGNYQSNSTGSIAVKDLLLQRPNDVVFLRSLFAEHTLEDAVRTLRIQSDVANGRLVGDWEFKSLPKIMEVMVASSYDDGTVKVWPKAKLEGYLRVGEVNWLADLLHLPLTVEPGSTLKWDYNRSGKNWSIESAIRSGAYGPYALTGLDLTIHHQGIYFDALVSVDQIQIAQTVVHELKAESHGSDMVRDVRFIGSLADSIPTTVTGKFKYVPGRALLENARFNIGLDTFSLASSKPVEWSKQYVQSDALEFKGSAGALQLAGRLSLTEEVKHKGTFSASLNARPLNYFLRTPEAVLGGAYALNVEFNDSTGSDWSAATSITGLSLNGTSYGSFKGQMSYLPEHSDVFIAGTLFDESQSYAIARGHYNTALDDLDLSLSVDALNVASLNPFFHEAIAGLEGHLEGGVQIYGPLNDWNARGEVYWNNGAIAIPLLGAQFSVADQSLITLSEKGFELDSIKLLSKVDETQALSWGGITHHQLKDFGLDIRLSTDSLLAMNKERNVEDMFYGTAVAAGEMHLMGLVEQLQLTVQATTKEGTLLKIPLDNPTAVELPGFIRFVDAELPRDTVQSVQGIRDYFGADLGIEVTPEARIELVLDEVLGDIIRAQGSGSMRLKILEDESVELYGVYTVNEGDYLFTLQNIINKQFDLIPGGTIAWSGDVYQAELDLKAVYTVQTDLTGLVTSANYNNEKVPVDLIISLTGPLLSPQIGFAIDLPASPASYQQELNRHFLNEEALHYQAFSLLMLGDFFQQNLGIQESINFESSLGNTTSELLVSEFGSWLAAGIGDYVTVDFDYTTGANPLTNFTNQGDNLNLGVSKNFFDGRLKLKSSFDVPIGQEQASTLLLGDTEVSLDLSKQGTIVLKAFNRSNRNDPLLQTTGPYTQGVGVQFKKDFDRVTTASKTDPQ